MRFHGHDMHPGMLVLVADHQLDSYDSAALIDDLQRAIDAGSHTLVVDCAEVGHVSTVAVARLVLLHRRLSGRGGELRLAAVQAPLRRVLGVTRLDHVFRIFATVDEAIQAPPQAAPAAPRWRSG